MREQHRFQSYQWCEHKSILDAAFIARADLNSGDDQSSWISDADAWNARRAYGQVSCFFAKVNLEFSSL